MKIDVLAIPDEGLEVEDSGTIEQSGGQQITARLKARIHRAGRDVFIRGEVNAGLSLVCSRCLKEFDRKISFPLDLAYIPATEFGGEEGRELTSGEMDTGVYSGEEIDLGDIVKEQVLLNLPMKPLCDEMCKGFCPKCGVNLNEQSCGCDLTAVDPRLQALKELLKNRKE